MSTPSPQSAVVVPVEPTEAMMLAGALVGPDTNNGQFGYDDARTVFVAMLAAAPAPSSLAGGEVRDAAKRLGSDLDEGRILDFAVSRDISIILAALSPEAPAREAGES